MASAERDRGVRVATSQLRRLRELFGRAGGEHFRGLQDVEGAFRENVQALDQLNVDARARLVDTAKSAKAGQVRGIEQAGLGGTSLAGSFSSGLNTQLQQDLDILDAQAQQAFGQLAQNRGESRARGLAGLADLAQQQLALEGPAFFEPLFNLFTNSN